MTNTFPVHRDELPPGSRSFRTGDVCARCSILAIERLAQSYRRLPDEDQNRCFDYRSPALRLPGAPRLRSGWAGALTIRVLPSATL